MSMKFAVAGAATPRLGLVKSAFSGTEDADDGGPESAIGGCGVADEAERTRLIGEISRVIREPHTPEATRCAGLTLIGWLARRMPGEKPHALGVEEARESERRLVAFNHPCGPSYASDGAAYGRGESPDGAAYGRGQSPDGAAYERGESPDGAPQSEREPPPRSDVSSSPLRVARRRGR